MKILFVVDNYMGGAGNIIQMLATEYAKIDEVTVLLTHKTVEKRYECPGVKFVELEAKDKPKNGIFGFPYQLIWIKKRIKEEKPEVIISFLTENSVFVCLGQMRSSIPIIACERINPLIAKWKFPWSYLIKKAYDRADLLTVQFDEFTRLWNGRYRDKCKVTPNYVATPAIFKDISNTGGVKRLVSCGRLNESKQFGMLIEMFEEIHRKNPNTELKIYGQGPYKENLENKIRELGLEDSAMLAGYTTDTYGVLCDADIYLMPSKNEGFPNALSEALAVGLPSVSFRCHKGIDELLDNGKRGVVVNLNDRQAFIDAVLDLCSNAQKCGEYSKNAKDVSAIYSMENIKAIWDECIKIAIEKRKNK